jgi:hypothetical protein
MWSEVLRRSAVGAAVVGAVGCVDLGPRLRGATCGGAQSAAAIATLPDTGIGAGADVQIALSQRDPYLIGELADLSVQHVWPQSRAPNPQPDPRVRLIRDDGRVLLDTVATRHIPNDGDPNRGSWLVFKTFSNAELRNAIYAAIRDSAITLELWSVGGSRPGTVVRPSTKEAFVSSIATCV